MRRLLALLLFLGAVASAAPDGEDSERPWTGILPDPGQKLGKPEQPGSEWYACRFLDAETGRPVAGVRWLRTPEWIAGWRLHHDVVLSVAVSDRDGIAHVPANSTEWRTDSHWLALAPGYAPAYEYAVAPPHEMLLRRGEPFRGRVIDAMGRALAGATVEVLGGCSHGTAAARALTGEDGAFSFERLADDACSQLWVEGPAIASELLAYSSQPSLGNRTVVLAMDAATRYDGRVVDLLGEPVAGVVLRAWNAQRGPATATSPDGRFSLDGVDGQSLQVFASADLTEDRGAWYVNDAHPGVPTTVVVSPLGVAEADPDAHVLVHTKTPEGAPVGGVAFALARTDDGRGPDGTTNDESPTSPDEPALGDGLEKVASGAYRVLPSDPFGAHTFDPAEVRAVAGKVAKAEVVVRAQPRLRILGDVSGSQRLRLAIAGAQIEGSENEGTWSPALPAQGDVTLTVRIQDRPPFFFPVGPTKDGLREVTVAIPKPKRVLLPPGAEDARLLDGGREAWGRLDGDAIATDASGPLTLRWTVGKQTFEARLDMPAEPGATASPSTSSMHPVVESVVVRVEVPPGVDEGDQEDRHEVEPGEMVVFRWPGWRALRSVAPPEGESVLRWAQAGLGLRIQDEDGKPVDALVLAADEVYEAPAGHLDLRGFEPGPVRVVVARRDHVGEGRELQLTLPAGVARERKVVLPAR